MVSKRQTDLMSVLPWVSGHGSGDPAAALRIVNQNSEKIREATPVWPMLRLAPGAVEVNGCIISGIARYRLCLA